MKIEKVSVDLSKMVPGTVIPKTDLEKLWREHTGEQIDFGLWMLGFRATIEGDAHREGLLIVLAQKHGDLHVLRAPEASDYLHARFETAAMSMARAHAKMARVDVDELSASERKRHGARLHCMAEQITALDAQRKRLGMVESAIALTQQIRTPGWTKPELNPSGRSGR